MKPITKKRTKAFLIDAAISTAVTLSVEYFLRKKIKNEAFHNLVTPTAIMWGLELVQLRNNGQTIGYKTMGLALENKEGSVPTTGQILKRMAHRDTIGSFIYLKDRTAFEGQDGSTLPHDEFSETVVKEL